MVLLDSDVIQQAYGYTYEELISRYVTPIQLLKYLIKRLMIIHGLISKKMQELFFSQNKSSQHIILLVRNTCRRYKIFPYNKMPLFPRKSRSKVCFSFLLFEEGLVLICLVVEVVASVIFRTCVLPQISHKKKQMHIILLATANIENKNVKDYFLVC